MRINPVAAPRIRLICLAYAGGSPDMFRGWPEGLAADVELLTLRLPGHGRRVKERPYDAWEPLVADATSVLAPYLAEPHAFYGHSFGARLSYEIAHEARQKFPGSTRRLVLSGCRSPRTPQHRPYMHEMDESRFCDALRRMGGTPAEILDDAAMRRLLLPAVRAEIRLAELWTDRHDVPLDAPVTAVYGHDDPIDDAAATSGWTAHSRAGEVVGLPGGHFFLDTHRPSLLEVIDARI